MIGEPKVMICIGMICLGAFLIHSSDIRAAELRESEVEEEMRTQKLFLMQIQQLTGPRQSLP